MPRKTFFRDEGEAEIDLASMRPRPDAAENVECHRQQSGYAASFNEAAARCRGKLRLVTTVRGSSILLQ